MKGRKQKAEGRRILGLFLLLLLVGCETKEHADAELGALKKARDAAAAASSRAAEPIGISECDDYISTYESCLAKVPDDKRAGFRATLNDQRRKWYAAATGGGDQAEIAQQCKSAASDALAKMSDYGCTF